MDMPLLTKEAWEASLSSRCWEYTPYDGGWDDCPDIATDRELAGIVAMEEALGVVPEWAERIVCTAIAHVPFCGHYRFPLAFVEVVDAIGSGTPPEFVHGCFTVDTQRKAHAQDYCLCLDAWLAGAPPEHAAGELAVVGARRIDWHAVCADLWRVLGKHTEVKDLLVERLLHFLRFCIKLPTSDDDPGPVFGRDSYLGVLATGSELNPSNAYSHAEPPAPGFDEAASPRVQRIEARLAEICPDWDRMRVLLLDEWWLCAPKAFRFLERKLWFVGKESPPDGEGFESDRWTAAWWRAFLAADVPPFLRCQDTYPQADEAARWWSAFCSALDAWWQEIHDTGDMADDVARRLGEPTPVKRWLVRLFVRRVRRIQENGEQFTSLVGPATQRSA